MGCDQTPTQTLNFPSNDQVSTNSQKCSETYVSELVLEGLGEGFQNQIFLDLESESSPNVTFPSPCRAKMELDAKYIYIYIYIYI